MKSKISVLRVTIIVSIVAFLLLLPIALQAQDAHDKDKAIIVIDNGMETWGDEMDEWGERLEYSIENGGHVPPFPPLPFGRDNDDDEYYSSRARLGAYIDDMDFEDAYEKHYPHCFGVYISEVTRGGNSDLAGIRGGDIVMEFDGEKVLFEDQLLRLRDSKSVGDTVAIKVFRNEKVFDTQLIFAPPTPKIQEKSKHYADMKKDRGIHPGFGGGGPKLILLDADFAGINKLLETNGFDKLSDTYMPLFGGYGMGNVGNGWFIGGGGYGYEKKQKVAVSDGYRKYTYNVGFGGMTINKKIALHKNIVVDLGLLIGGGSASLELRQTDGKYSWDDDFDNKPGYYSLKFRKHFMAYHPSAGVLVRVLPWMGVHVSAGYLGSYSFNDSWKEDYFKYDVKGDSPDPLNGVSYSIGVWFGY